jgi:hypothetical protein
MLSYWWNELWKIIPARVKEILRRYNVVIWHYRPDMPTDTLLKHHRFCRKIIVAHYFFMTTGISSFVESVLIERFFHTNNNGALQSEAQRLGLRAARLGRAGV